MSGHCSWACISYTFSLQNSDIVSILVNIVLISYRNWNPDIDPSLAWTKFSTSPYSMRYSRPPRSRQSGVSRTVPGGRRHVDEFTTLAVGRKRPVVTANDRLETNTCICCGTACDSQWGARYVAILYSSGLLTWAMWKYPVAGIYNEPKP